MSQQLSVKVPVSHSDQSSSIKRSNVEKLEHKTKDTPKQPLSHGIPKKQPSSTQPQANNRSSSQAKKHKEKSDYKMPNHKPKDYEEQFPVILIRHCLYSNFT